MNATCATPHFETGSREVSAFVGRIALNAARRGLAPGRRPSHAAEAVGLVAEADVGQAGGLAVPGRGAAAVLAVFQLPPRRTRSSPRCGPGRVLRRPPAGRSFRRRSRCTTRPRCRACRRGPRGWAASASPGASCLGRVVLEPGVARPARPGRRRTTSAWRCPRGRRIPIRPRSAAGSRRPRNRTASVFRS